MEEPDCLEKSCAQRSPARLGHGRHPSLAQVDGTPGARHPGRRTRQRPSHQVDESPSRSQSVSKLDRTRMRGPAAAVPLRKECCAFAPVYPPPENKSPSTLGTTNSERKGTPGDNTALNEPVIPTNNLRTQGWPRMYASRYRCWARIGAGVVVSGRMNGVTDAAEWSGMGILWRLGPPDRDQEHGGFGDPMVCVELDMQGTAVCLEPVEIRPGTFVVRSTGSYHVPGDDPMKGVLWGAFPCGKAGHSAS